VDTISPELYPMVASNRPIEFSEKPVATPKPKSGQLYSVLNRVL
jgi:hypothetical protein